MNKVIGLICGAALVAGCATTDTGKPSWYAQVDNIHERHAGQDVNSITFVNAHSWYRGGNNTVVLETRRDNHYLISLSGPCDNEIRFSQSLRMNTTQRNRLSTFDSITVGDQTCPILRIRPIDMAAVREELAELDSDEAKDAGRRDVQVSSGGT